MSERGGSRGGGGGGGGIQGARNAAAARVVCTMLCIASVAVMRERKTNIILAVQPILRRDKRCGSGETRGYRWAIVCVGGAG